MSPCILWLQNILKNNSVFNNSVPIINKYGAQILIIYNIYVCNICKYHYLEKKSISTKKYYSLLLFKAYIIV